jgi:hydrogenase maturation protein HypF
VTPAPVSRDRGAIAARRWVVEGRVQGVGFRPFVYRLAHELGLAGWVRNDSGTVSIHGEGPPQALDAFEESLLDRAPPLARPRILAVGAVPPEPARGFAIRDSGGQERPRIHVPPDQFACDDCLAEMRDPRARRHRYPFTNCTQCGPRYTIIRALPYDRPNTTLAGFTLCADCEREYRDPLDRRFHAQPLACPACGPRLAWRRGYTRIAGNEAALRACIESLRQGAIVAVRGVGGYHLMCSASDEGAVATLRARKRRPGKPLALMLPWRGADGLDLARRLAELAPEQAEALRDPQRPIVLAARRPGAPVSPSVAPGLRELGLMLPYSPLHHLLLDGYGAALVATSGNISGEPVLTEPADAETRLAEVAEAFLHHDRPIQRPADDPVLQLNTGRLRPLRIGRGNGPLELELPRPLKRPTLALGAFLKNTVALAWDERVVVSPHIGELESPRSRAVFEQVASDLQRLYGVKAAQVACDAHPDFPNSRWARRSGLPVVEVLHHHAHASALAAEFPGDDPILCFTWDGVGAGEGGELWGGEAFLGAPGHWRRVASFRPFALPGGDAAAREPWRSAAALCWELGRVYPGAEPEDLPLVLLLLEGRRAVPRTSAAGRLFDAASALAGVCAEASFEGEAPMRLEALCPPQPLPGPELPLAPDPAGVLRSDWAPLVELMADARLPVPERAGRFHAAMAQALVAQARAVQARHAVRRVGLTGGVFQNRTLGALAHAGLEAAGFEVLLPERVPVNDAGISFGQAVEAAARGGP